MSVTRTCNWCGVTVPLGETLEWSYGWANQQCLDGGGGKLLRWIDLRFATAGEGISIRERNAPWNKRFDLCSPACILRFISSRFAGVATPHTPPGGRAFPETKEHT